MDLSSILNLIPAQYAIYAAAVIGVCSAIASVLHPPRAGSAWSVPYKILSLVAFNVGWARNHYSPTQK